ncbi:unnamed protein product [Dimorphilus gyrociliatus]|uniref:Uncharacterized protein n=1 Tax=Dimorphilus gyrociliatus TaxID=2664684 RepID=A0A7I8WCV8_9ANNE|nr:unnamed protein product [Dimorphilus gyrociliatus]
MSPPPPPRPSSTSLSQLIREERVASNPSPPRPTLAPGIDSSPVAPLVVPDSPPPPSCDTERDGSYDEDADIIPSSLVPSSSSPPPLSCPRSPARDWSPPPRLDRSVSRDHEVTNDNNNNSLLPDPPSPPPAHVSHQQLEREREEQLSGFAAAILTEFAPKIIGSQSEWSRVEEVFDAWVLAISNAKSRVHESAGGRVANRNFARPPPNAANNQWQAATNIQRAYKRNPASTFRRIANPEETKCSASIEDMTSFFIESVAPPPPSYQWSPDREFLPAAAPPPDPEDVQLANEIPPALTPDTFNFESRAIDGIELTDPNHPLLRPHPALRLSASLSEPTTLLPVLTASPTRILRNSIRKA